MREIAKLVNQAIKEFRPAWEEDYSVRTRFEGRTTTLSANRLGIYRIEIVDAHFDLEKMPKIAERLGQLVGYVPDLTKGYYIYWIDNKAFKMAIKYDTPDFGKDSNAAIVLLNNKENLIGKEMIVEVPLEYIVEIDGKLQRVSVKGRLVDIHTYNEFPGEEMVAFKFEPLDDNVDIEDIYYGDSSDTFTITKYPFEKLKYQIIGEDKN